MNSRVHSRKNAGTTVVFEELEAWVRTKVQGFVQRILEEETTELLGRGRSERREDPEQQKGYRNGYGKERKLTMSCGTIRVRRPRVRDLEERRVVETKRA